jgi:tetratricopeptide (TPR) repeat protein
MRLQPDDRKAREALAAAQFAVAAQQRGRPSMPAWRATLASYEALLAERPNDGNSLRNVALVLKYLASAHDEEREPEQAEVLHRRALQLDERRLAMAPDSRQAQFDVAIDLLGVALAMSERGDLAGAVPLLQRSIELRAQLAVSDPDDVLARGRLAVAQNRLASVRLDLGDFEAVEPLLTAADAGLAAVSRLRREPWVAKEQALGLSKRARLSIARGQPLARRCALLEQAITAYDAVGRASLSSKEQEERAFLEGQRPSCVTAPSSADQ